ncbi:MAG TPA: sulfatase [Thermoanaerobaculia bacterium]|nr:sulfatase [Thermoanaerobaculia bacterium]
MLPLLLTAAVACRPSPARQPRAQNLLLVVVDTLRVDRGVVGDPSADAAVPPSLLNRGRRFSRAISASIHTKPSMLALFTGSYPSQSGLVANGAKVLHPAGPMLAERLRDAGFATAAVVSNPNLVGQSVGFDRGFDSFDARMTGVEPNRPTGTRNAAETTDAALAKLRELEHSGKRWFLWVHYLEPHGPYRPPEAFVKRPADPGAPLPLASGDFAGKGELPKYQYLPECRGRADYAARYRGNAQYALSEVERLLHSVYASGEGASTAVVLTADHGEFLGEEDYWFQHGMRIDPVLFHVPLVVARSAGDPRSEENRFVGHVDLVPTLAHLLGLPAPRTEGEDLFALAPARRLPLLVEYLALPEILEVGVERDGSVIVQSNREPPTEFVAENGPWLARAPNAASLRAAADVLRPHLARIWKTPVEKQSMTPEQIRVLRSLGYVAGN